jgi:hypothetical protein
MRFLPAFGIDMLIKIALFIKKPIAVKGKPKSLAVLQ